MGLDTGMELRVPLRDSNEKIIIDVLYFRKCFGIAKELADIVSTRLGGIPDGGYDSAWTFKADVYNLAIILDTLCSDYNVILEGGFSRTTWTAGEYVTILNRNIHQIRALIAFLNGNFDVEDYLDCNTEAKDKQREQFITEVAQDNLDLKRAELYFYNSY